MSQSRRLRSSVERRDAGRMHLQAASGESRVMHVPMRSFHGSSSLKTQCRGEVRLPTTASLQKKVSRRTRNGPHINGLERTKSRCRKAMTTATRVVTGFSYVLLFGG
jgi:hypothetical protein